MLHVAVFVMILFQTMLRFSAEEWFADGSNNRKTESSCANIGGQRIRHRLLMLSHERV
jgi:hypothetical protein